MSEIYEHVVEDLMNLDIFCGYKYRKRDSEIYRKIDGGEFIVYLAHRTDWILQKMSIDPCFYVRFKVLHRWYEKFNVKSRNDARTNPSYMFYDKNMFKKPYIFYFNTAGEHYNMDFAMLALDLIEKVSYYYPRYSTLQGCYDMEIVPVMEGKKSLPSCGADWVFVDLALCKLVSPEIYPEFKKIVLKHIDWLRSRREPNIARYEGRFDEIFHYLETTDITKIK